MTVRSLSKARDSRDFDRYFNTTFATIYPVAKSIVYKNLPRYAFLRKMMDHTLCDKSPSDYAFIFRFSYQLGGNPFSKVCKIAAGIHLIQTSTFVIDDIFDESRTRADRESVCKSYGTKNAIIAGELLQTIGLNIITSEIATKCFPNGHAVIRLIGDIMKEVYVGQYMDLYNSARHKASLDSYYGMISLTTGKFLSNISKAGALLSDLSKHHVKTLANYGYFYGMALQICDDIVDVTDDAKSTGKTFACDIKGRRLRLPLLLALKLSTKSERHLLTRFISSRNKITSQDVRRVIRIIRGCGAIDQCKWMAKEWVQEALRAISCLDDNISRKMLKLMAGSLLRDIGVTK